MSPWYSRAVGQLVQIPIDQNRGSTTVGRESFEIWMKLAANGSLSEHLGAGKPAWRGYLRDSTRNAALICAIVLRMKYVQGNILLDQNCRGLICDFGLSRMRPAEGEPTGNAGTGLYAGPEKSPAKAPYNEKVDVFTFELLAYEIVEGCPAFRHTRPSKLPALPDSFGPRLQQLIRKCWSRAPDERPSFEDIFNLFKDENWEILPEADAMRVAASVSQVTRLEKSVTSGQ
jgi:hypothetical protein